MKYTWRSHDRGPESLLLLLPEYLKTLNRVRVFKDSKQGKMEEYLKTVNSVNGRVFKDSKQFKWKSI